MAPKKQEVPAEAPVQAAPEGPAQPVYQEPAPQPPQEVAPVEKVPEAEPAPAPDEPINFAEPISAADQTAIVADSPQEQAISELQMAELQRLAGHENVKRDFMLKVQEARKPEPPAAAPPPLAPRIVDQTNAEMAAGRALNEKFAAQAALNKPKPVDPAEGKNEAVFRPNDYVPNQRKGQGNVQGRNL